MRNDSGELKIPYIGNQPNPESARDFLIQKGIIKEEQQNAQQTNLDERGADLPAELVNDEIQDEWHEYGPQVALHCLEKIKELDDSQIVRIIVSSKRNNYSDQSLGELTVQDLRDQLKKSDPNRALMIRIPGGDVIDISYKDGATFFDIQPVTWDQRRQEAEERDLEMDREALKKLGIPGPLLYAFHSPEDDEQDEKQGTNISEESYSMLTPKEIVKYAKMIEEYYKRKEFGGHA